MSGDLIKHVARLATNDEAKAFARHFRAAMSDYTDANYPINFFGSPLDEPANAENILSRDYWLTWRPRGEHCILAQCNPDAKKRKKDSDTQSTEAPASPELYLILPSNRLYVVTSKVHQNFRRFNPRTDMFSFPTVALEGFLVERERMPASASSQHIETLRQRTIASLDSSSSSSSSSSPVQDLPRDVEIVFLAMDCLWSRISRFSEEMQQRARQARQMIDGEPHQEPMLTDRITDVAEHNDRIASIEYMPSMPSMNWLAVVSDVPPQLRGCQLDGVIFRHSSAEHDRSEKTTFVITSGVRVRALMRELREEGADTDSDENE